MMSSKTILSLIGTVLVSQFLILAPATCDETRASQDTSSHGIALPTPLTNYETFRSGTSGLPLLTELMKQLDPDAQKTMLTFIAVSG